MATRMFSHHNEPSDDMDGKTGRDNRMVCPQRRLETPIFVCWIFAVYGDDLEVLSLGKLALEAMDINKRIAASSSAILLLRKIDF
jgi:hypothetical protein